MVKYILRRKSGNKITYVYRTGQKFTVKVNYEKFLNDLVKYAGAKPEDIESQEDLISLFDKASDKGADFGKTEDSKRAVMREWEKRGLVFKRKKEAREEYLERQLEKELDGDKKVVIERKIVRVREKGHIVTKEQYTVLFNWVFK